MSNGLEIYHRPLSHRQALCLNPLPASCLAPHFPIALVKALSHPSLVMSALFGCSALTEGESQLAHRAPSGLALLSDYLLMSALQYLMARQS